MRFAFILLVSLLVGAPNAALAFFENPRTFRVDCDTSPLTITKVLRFAEDGDTIELSGTCTETVVIDKGVTLDGGGTASLAPADPADSTLTITARDVTIRGLFLESPAFFQVFIFNGATVTIEDSAIRNAARFGVSSAGNSVVTLLGNTIADNALGGAIGLSGAEYSVGTRLFFDVPRPNTIENNGQFGLVVAGNAGARVLGGNVFTGHAIGVGVVEGAQARIAGNVIDGNGIGLLVDSGAMVRLPDTDNAVPALNELNSGTNGQLGIACAGGTLLGVIDGLEPARALPAAPGALGGPTSGRTTLCTDQTETLAATP